MASILQFVARTEQVRRRISSEAVLQCQIVIFPGVRYERWDDDGGNNPTPQPKRKRALRARAQKAG